jgi:thiol-disulfide isomerase/thioredoxin
MHKLILSFVLLCSLHSFSQSITMEFPAFAGKTYDFIIFQGSQQETVQQDTIPTNGKFVLTIPKKYAPYTGMCRWLITNTADGGGLDMAIPGYDFEVSCLSATPDNDIIIYKGFDAVKELNRLNAMQQVIIDKFETMSKAAQLYDKKHKLYKSFAQEAAIQIESFESFQEDLKQNPNYNARFLPIVNLTKGIPHRLTDDYNQKAVLVNEFITQKVSFEDMYVSGHWQGIIQSWVVLQMNVVNDKVKFAQDFKLISDRIKNPAHYTDFVGKVTYYLTQYGKDDYVEAIAKTVLSSGKVSDYLGVMEVYLKSMVGMKAPDLVIIESIGKIDEHKNNNTVLKTDKLNSNYSLLIFYKTGCGPCEETMLGLQDNYQDLVAKGIKIITIAADTDKQEYEKKAAPFPWKDKYCNFDGTSGINFKNYAVIGTPTMFLLDSKGIIIEKIATVAQLLAWIEKS